MKKKRIGVIGCGVIGSALAAYALEELGTRIESLLLYDKDASKKETLRAKLGDGTVGCGDMDELVRGSDLVVEAAVGEIVPELIEMASENEKDLMVMSVGGVLGREDALERAREKGIRIFFPSGAVSGIDALKACGLGGIESVTLTTRKPPASLRGAPYLDREGIDVDKVDRETIVFEGTARDAVKAFPRNINVSAVLSLAGIGADRTRVRIIVSPEYKNNCHEVEIVAGSGKVFTRTENVPSPGNPKTSYLAALSAMVCLKGYFETVRIGN